MPTVVEIENPITEKIKTITGETSDDKAIKIALERFVRDYEIKPENGSSEANKHDLPDEHWEELFSQPQIPSSVIDRILREEREDRF